MPDQICTAVIQCPAHKYLPMGLLKFALEENGYSGKDREFARFLHRYEPGQQRLW